VVDSGKKNRKAMKILFVSVGDNGGGSYWLADAINKHTDHVARSIRIAQSYINYPYDILNPSDEDIVRWGQWADIIHVRDGAPRCLDNLDGKRRFITFTGMSFRKKAPVLVSHYRNLEYTVCVSTADLIAYHPDNPPVWIPNPRDEMVSTEKFDSFTVCHAPTYRERKGTQTVIDACKLAKIDLELLERKSYVEVMRVKSRCHILVDQFAYGYGNNAIEAWALGEPVVSYGNAKMLSAIADHFDGRIPFCKCQEDSNSLAGILARMRDDKSFRDMYIDLGREFFSTHHDSRSVASKLVDMYRS
jgi:glycosyltransferase involved in cell wall biosynthesis